MAATSSPPTAMATYDALAPFYDGLTAHHDYESWTSNLEEVALRHGLRGKKLLDVACGTGKSFLPFLQRDYEVTACDISAAMLGRAQAKAPDAELIVADMRELPALGNFDLITCLDDSLNYLLEVEELAAAIGGMAKNLAPAGILLFDINTLLAYRTTFATVEVSEREGILYIWRGETAPSVEPGALASASVEVFEPVDGALYRRSTNRHVQRHYESQLVLELLDELKLDCLGAYAQQIDGSLKPGGEEEPSHKTIYLVRQSSRQKHSAPSGE